LNVFKRFFFYNVFFHLRLKKPEQMCCTGVSTERRLGCIYSTKRTRDRSISYSSL